MQPTEQQIQRSLEALRTDGTRRGGADLRSGDVFFAGRGDELCRLDDVPTEVFARLLEAPLVRADRLEQARRRLARGDTPTAEDLATRMIGRLLCDRLR
jgi:hypothetical protein